MFHKFDPAGWLMQKLWARFSDCQWLYLRIPRGLARPVACRRESTGSGSMTVAGTSEAVAIRGRRETLDPYPQRADAFSTLCRITARIVPP